ncbi:MAG: cyclase family protein, partial [Thermodesulfobacteriota bacterium]|nr:cyclase family protein [Thermodesulfobacteriota bacterium]
MGQTIIDLSITIESGLPSDPEMMIPQIEYIDHIAGAVQMEEFFPGLKKEQLPQGLGWAFEHLNITTHSGTHLDAPLHYHPTMDQGRPAMTIDQIPLKWCFSDGVVLDFSHKADGERIMAADVEAELDGIG